MENHPERSIVIVTYFF